MTGAGPAGPPPPPTLSRRERFGLVSSTQDVVRGWLAEGQAEVCVAVADEQTAGRGRLGRRWQAPPGRALLVSAGFRPADLPLGAAWHLSAVAAMAMLEAARALTEREGERLGLKWPNDLVVRRGERVHKVGGILAEAEPAGERLGSAAIGIGVNVDWPAAAFPPDLAEGMSSLSQCAGRPVDRDALLEAWLARLLDAYRELVTGHFDAHGWASAQVTTGARVQVETSRGRLEGTAVGVDLESGALLLREATRGDVRAVTAGEVTSCRLDPSSGGL